MKRCIYLFRSEVKKTDYAAPPLPVVLTILLLIGPVCLAQPAGSAAATGETDLARQTQNPVASLISVPLQGNWDFGLGSREAVGTTLNIQPVLPFTLTRNTNLILRIILPVTSQPASDGSRINGLGDILMTAFFSPQKTGKVIWGIGPAFLLPVATHQAIGSEKFGLGPSAVALVQPGKFTVGILFNHVWSAAGAEVRTDVNTSYGQPFLSYNLGKGLALGVSSEITTNWKAEQKTTAPLLFAVSKVALLGRQPVNFTWAAGPTLTSPEGGPEWRFRFQTNFLFPR